MSNNKQTMKLYTEEQVRQAWNVAYIDALAIDNEDYKPKFYDEFINELTPIELPSDEEIRQERLLQFPDTEYTNRTNDRLAFYCGAKFVMNKIKGGNNEND